MLFPLAVALVAVAVGALLALGPRANDKALRIIRIVSMAAAIGVIAVHLAPEALHALGAWALVAFVGGLGAPKAVEWVAESVARSSTAAPANGSLPKGGHGSHAGLEVGYAGLVVHRFGDGLSMGAYAESPAPLAARAGVILAFAAHIVPVTTVMVLAILSVKGRRAAYGYAAGLGAAIAAGVVAASFALGELSQGVEPWVSAVVAGLLLHVVAHDF